MGNNVARDARDVSEESEAEQVHAADVEALAAAMLQREIERLSSEVIRSAVERAKRSLAPTVATRDALRNALLALAGQGRKADSHARMYFLECLDRAPEFQRRAEADRLAVEHLLDRLSIGKAAKGEARQMSALIDVLDDGTAGLAAMPHLKWFYDKFPNFPTHPLSAAGMVLREFGALYPDVASQLDEAEVATALIAWEGGGRKKWGPVAEVFARANLRIEAEPLRIAWNRWRHGRSSP